MIVQTYPILVLNYFQRFKNHPVSLETFHSDDFDMMEGEYFSEFLKKVQYLSPHRRQRLADFFRKAAILIEEGEDIDWFECCTKRGK